jgi:hypothetical protein
MIFPKEQIEKWFVAKVVNCEKISTGSIFAYDKNGNKYFAVNHLVEKFRNSCFEDLDNGTPMFILVTEEIWTGKKWNNKVVQKIVFLSESIESINKFKKLVEEIDNSRSMMYNLNVEALQILKHQGDFNKDFHQQRMQQIQSFTNLSYIDLFSKGLTEIKNLQLSEMDEIKKKIEDNKIKLLALFDEYEKMFD